MALYHTVTDRDGFIDEYKNLLGEKAKAAKYKIYAIVDAVTAALRCNNLSNLVDPPGVNVKSGGDFPLLNIFIPVPKDGDDSFVDTYYGALKKCINHTLKRNCMPFKVSGVFLSTLMHPEDDGRTWDIWITLKYVI